MVMLADVGGVSGVRSTLGSVRVPPDVIEGIVKVLEATAGGLDPEALSEVKGHWFGGSDAASTLALHTGKAHLKLNNAILEAVAGIQGTKAAMVQFDQELSAADADSEAVARALLARTQQAVDQMDGDRRTPPPADPTSTPGRDH